MDGAEEGSPQVINFQIMFPVAAGNTHRFPAWGGENYSQYDETFMVECLRNHFSFTLSGIKNDQI